MAVGLSALARAAAGSAQPQKRSQYSNPLLPPEQKSSLLNQLRQSSGGAIEYLGNALDTPGAITRGVLAGKPTSGFSFNPDVRVSGKELLEQYGVIDKNTNPYASGLASFATEVALDPFAILSGPLGALGKGGKAVRAAGLLDKAGDAAMARIGLDAARRSMTGKRTTNFLSNILPQKQALNPANYKIRPLVGPRRAQATATVRDVVEGQAKNADEIKRNIQAVENYLRPNMSSYAEVADQKLGGAMGLGFFTPAVTFGNADNKAIASALDALDATGQAMQWSAPARAGSAFFDKRVAGTYDAADQLYALKAAKEFSLDNKQARQLSARHVEKASNLAIGPKAQKLLGSDSLWSEEGNNYLTRIFEGVQTGKDEMLTDLLGRPQIEDLASGWAKINDQQVAAAKRLGIDKKTGNNFRKNVKYSPRIAAEADFGEYGAGASRAVYSGNLLANEGRREALMTPGGTVDMREISQMPIVQQFLKEKDKATQDATIDTVATKIKDYLDNKHGEAGRLADPMKARATPFSTYLMSNRTNAGMLPSHDKDLFGELFEKFKLPNEVISKKDSEQIARFMQRMSDDVPDGTPMFSQHPLAAQAKNIVANTVARGNVKFVIDSIAEAAVEGAPNMLRAKNDAFTELGSAMNRIGGKIGVNYQEGSKGITKNFQTQIRESIAEKLSRQTGKRVDPDAVDVNQFALPESVERRLTRINDFYSSPAMQSKVVDFFNQYTQIYKAFLLAFPSRHVRDMYSNAFSVWLETGDPVTTNWGFSAAKLIMAGKHDEAATMLSKIPGYPTDATAIRQKLVDDVSGSGILDTLASSDVMLTNPTNTMNQLAPGSNPVGKYDFMKEFVPGKGTFDKASDMLQFRGSNLFGLQATRATETKNPLLTASQQFSDYTDSVARLGGFLAMMKQGASPSYASERITEILIDYSSLTQFERKVMRGIFPWYAYNSRIGSAVAKQLLRQPGGAYAQTIRGMRVLQEGDEDTYIPEALRQQFAIRVPDSVKQAVGIDTSDSDTTTFLKDIDIPGMDVISMLDIQPNTYGTISGTTKNLFNQATPLIRSVAEYGTDTDFFSRRPLREATKPIDRLYKKAFNTTQNLDPTIRTMLELIPSPRLAGTLGGLADDRIPMNQRIMKQAVNALTGVKLTDADPEWMLQDARRKAADILNPYMESYSQTFIPEDRLPEVPAELMPYYYLYKSLGKDLRNSRKQDQPAARMKGL